MIKTQRLTLMPFEDAHFQAILSKNLVQLGQLLHIETPTQWTTFPDMEEALPYFYEAFKENGNEWSSYFAIHTADRQLLGTCGFKGGIDETGAVEIGYEIREDYRRQGLATELSKGLMDYAFLNSSVQTIRAHTLAHENPSVFVLKKLNFTYICQISDPDDGEIWRWEYKK